MSEWSQMELIRRGMSLGASDTQLNACTEAGDAAAVRASLLELVGSLEPPPPEAAALEDLVVDPTTPLEEMISRLHTFGAVVIKNAADPALVDAVDSEVGRHGGWSADPKDRAEGSRDSRGGMDFLLRAPSLEGLYTHPLAMAVVKELLGKFCRRVMLKEIEIFAVQPGQGKQLFHREDQFWPWRKIVILSRFACCPSR